VKIALLGTRGVPARYGGFETAVEEIGKRLAARGHEVVVYCRNDRQEITTYLGMRLVNLPALRLKQTETLSHTALSVAHIAMHPCDVAIAFNVANAPVILGLRARRIPVALHVDGLEWKRAKWSGAGRRYFVLAERIGVRTADCLIADARAIQDYYAKQYGVQSRFIAYGAPILSVRSTERIQALGLRAREYYLAVARLEPENNVHLIVSAFAQSDTRFPLIVVGDAPHAERYGESLRGAAVGADVRFLGGVWDRELLDDLYAHSLVYAHGHSVGGTNPSLLRAMGASAPIAAYDVVFNREVLGAAGQYFRAEDDLRRILLEAQTAPERFSRYGEAARTRAAAEYDWERVAEDYERLCHELSASGQHRTRNGTKR
jgi:glycosyltransferase involved in cell wall biosynthesis